MPQEGENSQMGQEPTTEPEAGQTPQDEPRQWETKGESPAFSEEYVKSLRSEAAKHRKDAQEAKTKAQEYEDRDKSELEKLTGKLTKADQRADQAEAKLLRYDVASEKEVPAKLVPLLTATSKAELEAQADLILENAKPAEPEQNFDGGARDPAPDPKTPEHAHDETVLRVLGLTS